MLDRHITARLLLTAALALSGIAPTLPGGAQEKPSTQLPEELRGAKVYQIPEDNRPGTSADNPVIYKNLSYQDINFERLVLNLSLSVKPVDRAATIRRIFFQDIRVNRIPVHIDTFASEFKVSKKDEVDLPAPLQCTIVFSELESLKPVKEIVDQDKILITGQSFIDVKLNPLEKMALRTRQLVIPVTLNEEVPLNMFSGNPLLQMAASRVLDTLSDPSTLAGMALARERLARTNEDRTLVSVARPSLCLLYAEYVLTDPKTHASEKFSATGTGFVVSEDGKLLTSKRVVEPWKFDPQVAFLMTRYHLEMDPHSVKYYAWPSGARVLLPDGQMDTRAALRSEDQTLSILKTAPDQMEKREYQDPDSREQATLTVHAEGTNDVAVLRLTGAKFPSLSLAEAGAQPAPEAKTALYAFPYGMSQAQPLPQVIYTQLKAESSGLAMDHVISPGESGAPLLSPEGKVLALAGSGNLAIPLDVARTLLR